MLEVHLVQCSVYIAASLDGFIARLDGRIDWLATVERAGEDYGYQRFRDSIDVCIVGRKTYETVLEFETWPYAGKRCIVMTHAALNAKHGEEFYCGPPEVLVERLSAEKAKRAYVDGGVVIQQFLSAGLISDLTVSVVPILLGEGVRLFGRTGRDLPLKFVASRAFESGLVKLEYRLPSVPFA
jgi:dihydrofolate reductase